MTKLTTFCAAASGLLAMTGMASAAESGPMNWGPGQPQVQFGALPPVAGLYFTNATGVLGTMQANGPGGTSNALGFTQSGVVDVMRFLGVWPALFANTQLATQVILPISSVGTNIGVTNTSGNASGVGNVSLVQIIDHTFAPYHHVGASLNYVSKLSSYAPNLRFNAASGYDTLAPAVFYNYFDPKGFDLGVMAGYYINGRNTTTNYQTGNMVGIDFKANYKITPEWKIGAFGGYLFQVDDDYNALGVNIGNRASILRMGPRVAYQLTPLIELAASYQVTLSAVNAPVSNIFWLSFSAPLFTAGAPPATAPAVIKR